MTRRRKIILATSAAALAVAVWIGIRVVYSLRRLPEAYAAWDTGTLLVEYLRTHDNHWPTSWDDLFTVLDTSPASQLVLRGPHSAEQDYKESLRKMIRVDWSFDPARPSDVSPVTRPDGSTFPVLWNGADPNEMIREHLELGHSGHDR